MLLSLNIKNYAIIDNVNITFGDGLNVLTGETGAGKSILIGALSMALGYRSSSAYIRSGETKSSVQALFCIEHNNDLLDKLLEENNIELEDGNILINRELYANGKNVCKINNTIVNVNLLKQIGLLLVDIHGQHEHQKLLDSSTHLALLDEFGRDALKEKLEKTKQDYLLMRSSYKKWHELSKQVQNQNEKLDEYTKQLKEIDEVELKTGEDELLSKRLKLLQNSEKIYDYIDTSYSLLYAEDANIINKLGIVSSRIEAAAAIDDGLKETFEAVNGAYIALDDAVIAIRDYKESIEFSPDELDDIHARLSKIEKLKRKYGASIFEILEYREKLVDSLKVIKNIDEELAKAKQAFISDRSAYLASSGKLSNERKKVAESLSEQLCANLAELAMNNTQFEVCFTPLEEKHYSPRGIDNIEFMISTNAGQDLKPLTKIASGGEVSRIMLSIKSILADVDKTETLIFDEIDTGISGRTAQTVAEKMASLSEEHQLICISHLPQIASMAHTHIRIGKHVEVGQTFTDVDLLNSEQRCEEVARMLGGVEVNETALSHANEMIRQAHEYKDNKK